MKRDYSIELEKKNVLGGYLLSAVLHHVGVVTDFGVRCCETARLFVTDAYIPKSFLAGLQIKSTVFSPELFLPELRAARKIVET